VKQQVVVVVGVWVRGKKRSRRLNGRQLCKAESRRNK
jgi:hypothetical protein